ncbi:MAG: SH3 domain-containing protein [Lachnospiraceae bacterium]|nr:SH3 domain-containing protein [Lachnospiraceae bacterium]
MEPLRKYRGDVWDRRQESRLNVGEPVTVKRMDGGWLYVTSEATEGYVREEGIFLCTRRHYERYLETLEKEYCVVIKSGRYRDGQYFRVGTVLPVLNQEPEYGCRGDAPAFVRNYLPFTERQIRLQTERMLDIPYSWGDERLDGMDCSSTLRAFYMCFGLSLPRNSDEQRSCGQTLFAMKQAAYEDLEGKSPQQKQELIAGLGVGAVLHMPGHVMLYMGERDGFPWIFHNVDTYTMDGTEYLVRKSIISRFLPKGEGTYLDYLTAAWRPIL